MWLAVNTNVPFDDVKPLLHVIEPIHSMDEHDECSICLTPFTDPIDPAEFAAFLAPLAPIAPLAPPAVPAELVRFSSSSSGTSKRDLFLAYISNRKNAMYVAKVKPELYERFGVPMPKFKRKKNDANPEAIKRARG